MILFLTSRIALSLICESAEARRSRIGSENEGDEDVVVVGVGMVGKFAGEFIAGGRGSGGDGGGDGGGGSSCKPEKTM